VIEKGRVGMERRAVGKYKAGEERGNSRVV